MARRQLGRAVLAPADLTPVCTAELGLTAKLASECETIFAKLAISGDMPLIGRSAVAFDALSAKTLT
jgi:hypothetical protein